MKLKTLSKSTVYLGIALIMFGCAKDQKVIQSSASFVLKNKNSKIYSGVHEISFEGKLKELLKDKSAGVYEVNGMKLELLADQKKKSIDKVLIKAESDSEFEVRLGIDEMTGPVSSGKLTQAELSIKMGGQWVERKYDGGDFKNVASLDVPSQHTDHSYFIRYEGPGLENELVGYRYYLDWRNALDIFGKKVNDLILQEVGQDGFDSYHEMADWGMDILKAGRSLGVGSMGRIVGDSVAHFQKTDSVKTRIKHNGNFMSSVETTYFGWDVNGIKTDLISTMCIYAGDRAVKHTLESSDPLENLCVGLVRHPEGQRIESIVGANGWAYVATYGKQSLADDQLGMALIYNTKDVSQVREAEYDHLLVFKPINKIQYYYLGAWEQEKGGVKSFEDFKNYLDEKISNLNNPVEIVLVE